MSESRACVSGRQGVEWGAQDGPGIAGNESRGLTRSLGTSKEGLMPQSTDYIPTKTTVRRTTDADHGRVWRVTYACGCPPRRFRTWDIALIFATAHRCPPPYTPAPLRRQLAAHGRWV